MELDFTKAIKLQQNIYWVGKYLANDPFQCHPYLLLDGENSVLIDPGSMLEFDDVIKKIESITSLNNIKYIIAHHQDPDLCASIPSIEKLINRDDLRVVTHHRNAALIKHYGITSEYFYIDTNDYELQLSDRILKFITTPYAHAPGAFMTYDESTKTLFSSDIFGAFEESWSFYADENYFEHIKLFHQEYMPGRDILNYALRKIDNLDIELILPQHGSMIKKEYISDLVTNLKNLDCGIYIGSEYTNELLRLQKDIEKEKEKYKQHVVHLKTIIDMQDNLIFVTNGVTLIECNRSFLNFLNVKDIEEFLAKQQCICENFIAVDDSRYLCSKIDNKVWTQYVVDNPNKEHRALLNDMYGNKATFTVHVNELDINEDAHVYIVTMSNITKELDELDFLQSLSMLDDLHYFIYNTQNRKYKISSSLSELLSVPINFHIDSIDLKKYFSRKDFVKILRSLKQESDKFEVATTINGNRHYFMVQSYKTFLDNSRQQVYIIVDISNIKHVQKESKQKDALIYQQSKMAQMGEMISMIAHQWRQPINAISASCIKLSLNNMLDKTTTEQVESHSEFVQKQCQNMSHVIDSFMNYSNGHNGDKKFNIFDTINKIEELIEAQYKAHNITLHVDRDEAINDEVYGREDMLQQVIINLLSNSRDAFTEAKSNDSKIINIIYHKKNELIVEDNAGGINELILNRLFTPYFTTKEQGKGTGLGLYMSKRIMNEQFSGDLTYEKIDDKSRFIIAIGDRSE